VIDLIESLPQHLKHQKVLDHGFVEVMDCMPRLSETGNGDYAIAEMARTSYQGGTVRVNDDANLVRYLVEHAHTSPLEGCELKLRIKLPIFVMRQLIRHRTASVNEQSARYSEMGDVFYVPETWTKNVGKQATTSGSFDEDTINEMRRNMVLNNVDAYDAYKVLLEAGLSREQARCVLPVSLYTMCVWKIDLNNLLKTLTLRLDKHAQMEIRVYAQAIANVTEHLWPAAWAAHKNCHIDGVRFTGEEVALMRRLAFFAETCPTPEGWLLEGWSQRKTKAFLDKITSIKGH
jgi:thymidylate synthase (FAD)